MALDLEDLPFDPAQMPSLDLDDLPSDPVQLRPLIWKMAAEIERLQAELARLLKHIYGPNSERFTPDKDGPPDKAPPAEPAGPNDPPAADPPPPAPGPNTGKPKRRRNGGGRNPLPPHLPRIDVVHDLPADKKCCSCCNHELVPIGEEVSEQLDYQPGSFVVRRHRRAKYACRGCDGIIEIAALPLQPVDKGLAAPGLLAQVIVSKFADHLPLYRQSAIFERADVHLHRSTLTDWIGQTADILEPVVKFMRFEILQSKVIHTDDTRIPVLAPGTKKTRVGRLWPYAGDADRPHVVFDYTPTREGDGPLQWLAGYRGYLHVDAYSAYDQLFKSGEIIEVACWAHSRRYFHEAKDKFPKEAAYALGAIQELYRIERKAARLSAPHRQQLRERRARPIIDSLGLWCKETRPRVRPKSVLGRAFTYVTNQWNALKRYLDDGILSIDNNTVENVLRGVALGRKNYLFAGNDDGGRRAAIHYSLIASCKRAGIDPFEYLRDVLTRIPTHLASAILELTPAGWAAARAAVAAQPP